MPARDVVGTAAALLAGVVVLAYTYWRQRRPPAATTRKAAFDIGSGATKVLIADVDATGVIVGAPIYETEKPMGYKADAQAHEGRLSDSIQACGLDLVVTLTAKARELGAAEASGIATEIFRTAPNGRAFLERLEARTGVRITILSQADEARLGLATAEALLGGVEFDAAWDSGGGSFQISAREGGGGGAPIASAALRTYTGKLGTGPSFERLLVRVQRKAYDVAATPNPVSAEETRRLVALLQGELAPAPDWLRGGAVAAIGGWNSIFAVTLRVLRHRVAGFASAGADDGGGSFTLDEAQRALEAVVGRSDAELLPVAGTTDDSEPPSLVVGKVALLVAVSSHLGLKRVLFRPATGGCAGLYALGDFQALARGEPFR